MTDRSNMALTIPTSTPPKPMGKKSSSGGNKKGTSAERRATHNAVERARRESLNVRFLQLAANLPTTCTVRRPSKSLIVNKSLEFVNRALTAEGQLRAKIDELARENASILDELNKYRQERMMSMRTSSVSIDSANMPSPLAEADFWKQSRQANFAISQGNTSLGGEMDDENSGQASNSSLSSTSSPPTTFLRTGSHNGSAFEMGSPEVNAGSLSGLPGTAQYFNDSIPSYQHHLQQHFAQYSALPSTYYDAQGISGQAQASFPQQSISPHQQHTSSVPSSAADFIPPVTPTTAAFVSQYMSSYPVHEGSMGQHPPSFTTASSMATPIASSTSDSTIPSREFPEEVSAGNNSSAFAALASNTFFDHRYSLAVPSPGDHHSSSA